jgi:xylulokinase
VATVGEAILAIDVGTSGARAVALDTEGRRLFEVRRAYQIVSPEPGRAEQDARLWRSASVAALGEAIRRLHGTRVLAIGLTGQCPSIVAVGRDGEPLSPGLMYRDNRATAEATEIRERFGDRRIHDLTGHLPAAFHILPKLLWLRRHRPEVMVAGPLFLQPRDLAAQALTGEAATDGTHAAATLLFDLERGDWNPAMFAAFDLDPAIFPPVIPSAAVLGMLRPALVKRFGLTGSVPVIIGGADSQACALGAGVVAPGPVSEMAGSSTCLNSVVAAPLSEPLITHYPHVVPGPFTTETGINTTGEAIKWVADLLYGGRAGRATGRDYLALDAEAAAVASGSDGVLALAILGDGERTDADLRAAFTGLSGRHGRAVMARAMMEGAAFAIRGQLDLLRGAGAPVTELRVSGGDTRLATWNVIKADATGLPLRTIPGDAATGGVAMLAGLGAGVYRDVDEAIARCVHPDPVIEPRPAARDVYDDAYAAFGELAGSPVVRRTGVAG